ncbi:MAG: TlpA disulfide reductase family protein [Verrucomicrobiota bacterium]
MKTIICTAMLLLVSSLSLFATSAKKNVGKTIPKLELSYVQAEPETIDGKPMILEFWATWCPPCRTSIPHLNDLYKKFDQDGLVVIGVTKEKKGVVEPFVEDFKDMDYSVAIDKTGALSKHFGVRGIPHALLVDKSGTVVWEGHPATLEKDQIRDILK